MSDEFPKKIEQRYLILNSLIYGTDSIIKRMETELRAKLFFESNTNSLPRRPSVGRTYDILSVLPRPAPEVTDRQVRELRQHPDGSRTYEVTTQVSVPAGYVLDKEGNVAVDLRLLLTPSLTPSLSEDHDMEERFRRKYSGLAHEPRDIPKFPSF